MDFSCVFKKENKNYRIPNIITTKNGIVVAAADERFFTGSDNPNRIEKIVARSLDSGATWQDYKTIVSEIGESKDNSSAAIDPALLYQASTNTIFMIYSHTPAGIGILNCKLSKGYYKGYKILRKGRELFYIKDNEIYTKSNQKTGYTVDNLGFIYLGKDNLGNYKIKNAPFFEERTSFLYITQSADEGLTWSEPVCLNNQLKNKHWGFIGAGPGIGVAIQKGSYKGRLIFPIYYGKLSFPPSLECATMYSDDNGKSWNLGQAVRSTGKFFNPLWLITPMWTTESQLVELPNGDLLNFVRNHHASRKIATALSTDGGLTWKNYKHHPQLPHPICQISALSFHRDGKDYILTCNAASTTARKTGIVRLSVDNGVTFPFSKVITEGEFVYSSATILPNGKIGILFEGETSHTKIDFVTLTLEEIIKG